MNEKDKNSVTMKLCTVCLASTFSAISAFAPSNNAGSRSDAVATILHASTGDAIRAARLTYASHGPGIIGSCARGGAHADARKVALDDAWKTLPPLDPSIFDTGADARAVRGGGASIVSVAVDDARRARTSAARGTGGGQPFVPHSSTGAGAHDVTDDASRGEVGAKKVALNDAWKLLPPLDPSDVTSPAVVSLGTGDLGSDARAARGGGASTASVVGEDARRARKTYAAHGMGVIGSDARRPFIPHSSTGAGAHDAACGWRT